MSPHHKAFIAAVAVSAIALFFFRRPFSDMLGAKRYYNWALTWLAITSFSFIITNFWLFAVASAAFIFIFSRAEPVKPAIYVLLLAATPPEAYYIPGFAGINKFLSISPQLVVAFVVLIPSFISGAQMKKIARTANTTDMLILLWLILQIALSIRAPTVTHMMRLGLEEFLGLAPLYYVLSRYPKRLEDLRAISAALVLSVLVLSAVSMVEFLRSWRLYNSVATNWGSTAPLWYTFREGYLRAAVTTQNPIAWGVVAMTGFGVALATLNDGASRFYRYAGLALLGAGVVVSMSRGPWVGAAVVVIMMALVSPKMITRSVQLAAAGGAALIAAMATPFGNRLLGLLPFIGDTAGNTIDYRQQLLEVSWQVILEKPFFGSVNYLDHPKMQVMRQGEGIIDIVNTYVQVLLGSGFVGLFLFVGILLSTLFAVYKAMKSARTHNPKLALYCQAYFATIVGMMLTIFTTSSVPPIPLFFWSLIALGVALTRIEAVERLKAEAPAAAPQDAPLLSPETAPATRFAWK